MRSNQALIAREAALPGLALLLDPVALADRLGVGVLVLDYLRLKHGTSCVAGYRLGDDWLIAKAVTADRAAEFQPGRNGRVVLPDLAVQVMPGSGDEKMRGLADALLPDRQGAFLRSLGKAAGLRLDRVVPLKLKPQRRLVARLDGEGQPRAFMKIHARGRFAPALAAAALAPVAMGPRLIFADAGSGVILTEWCDAATASAAQAGQAGEVLARLHRSALPLPVKVTRATEMTALQAVLDDCAGLLPDLAPRLAEMGLRLSGALLARPQRRGPTHGDFSADQLLLGAGDPCLIDWDRAAIADQGGDLGCFLARLDKDALDGKLAHDRLGDLREALFAGYTARADLPASAGVQRLRHLALLLTEDFRHQRADWDLRIAALLDRIEDGLDTLGPGLLARPDPALPMLADALATPPEGARIMRHKPGKRAIIRYPVAAGATLGKMNRKGLDRFAIALHGRLRAAGFDGSDPLRVEVPQVIGQSEEMGLWLMPELPGRSLTALLEGRETEAFRRCGAMLARLHGAPVAAGRDWTPAQEAGVLTRAMDQAAGARPDLAADLRGIGADLAARLLALPPAQPALLHRDFYPDQVLVQPDRLVLLDLDLAAIGDPAVDIGNFIAHLTEYGLRHGDADAHAAQQDAFLDGYAGVALLPDPARLSLLARLSLARHLHICLRIPDRAAIFDPLLAYLADTEYS